MSRPSRNRVDDSNANYPRTLSSVRSRPRISQPPTWRCRQPCRVHWPDQEQMSRNERLPYARDGGPDTPMWMQLRDLGSSLPSPRPVSGPTKEMARRPSAPSPSTTRRQTYNLGTERPEVVAERREGRRRSIDAAHAARQDTRERAVQRHQTRSQNSRVDAMYHDEEVTRLGRRLFGAPEYEVRRFDAMMIRRDGEDVSRRHVGPRYVRDDEPDDQWSTTATVGSRGRGRSPRRDSSGPENGDGRMRGRVEHDSWRRR